MRSLIVKLTLHAEGLRVEQWDIGGAILSLASINRLIIGDVGDDVQLRLHRSGDGFRLSINLWRNESLKLFYVARLRVKTFLSFLNHVRIAGGLPPEDMHKSF